jgi:hypothetical protein
MNDLKHLFDGLSLASAAAALMGVVPHVSALLGLIWLCFRIREIRLSIQVKKLEVAKLQKEVGDDQQSKP